MVFHGRNLAQPTVLSSLSNARWFETTHAHQHVPRPLYSAVTFVALLRGINVGGKDTVAMGRLKTCFEDLGFSEVRTYLNSGNVVFETGRTSPRALETKIEKALEKDFRFPIRVLVRRGQEIDRVVRSIPVAWKGSKTHRCNVIFLSPAIDKPSILKALRPRDGVDDIAYRRGAVLWAVSFKGLNKSGLQRVIGDPIYKEMTIRSVSTTVKLHDLMRRDAD